MSSRGSLRRRASASAKRLAISVSKYSTLGDEDEKLIAGGGVAVVAK